MSFAFVCSPPSKAWQTRNADRFAVEVRNKDWLDARLADVLRDHNVALALTDTSFMPRPWEMKGALDLVTPSHGARKRRIPCDPSNDFIVYR